MLRRHARARLSAYALGDLDPEASRRVALHLMRCRRCRAIYEEIKAGAELARELPLVEAPASLWTEIASALDAVPGTGAVPAAPPDRPRGRPRSRRLAPAAALAAAAALVLAPAAVLLWRLGSARAEAAWDVAVVEGAPFVGESHVGAGAPLPVGRWIETDAASRARLTSPRVGRVDVAANTRVRLLSAGILEHRIDLARGTIDAVIWAPPRLFFVDAPGAEAVDLGCAYTLSVDAAGNGFLEVTAGWVELRRGGPRALVPAGARCEMRAGAGPGTPYFEDVPEAFREALAALDRDPADAAALDALLGSARDRDTLSLWHLLPRIGEEGRGRIVDALAAAAPSPPGVTREGILALEEGMLEAWREVLEGRWLAGGVPEAPGPWRRVVKRVLVGAAS